MHKLEVTSLHGLMGESLSLISRVMPAQNAAEWLNNIEQNMRTSVNTSLAACVKARLNDSKTTFCIL